MKSLAPDVIDSFTGGHRFLSNFYASIVALDGWSYPTVEHAFQAAKTKNDKQRRQILECESPGEAKRLGRIVTLRKDWEQVKLGVMYKLAYQKFDCNDVLADRLCSTYPAVLVEGNDWGDTYWGVCKGVGENWLGRILMIVRSELT